MPCMHPARPDAAAAAFQSAGSTTCCWLPFSQRSRCSACLRVPPGTSYAGCPHPHAIEHSPAKLHTQLASICSTSPSTSHARYSARRPPCQAILSYASPPCAPAAGPACLLTHPRKGLGFSHQHLAPALQRCALYAVTARTLTGHTRLRASHPPIIPTHLSSSHHAAACKGPSRRHMGTSPTAPCWPPSPHKLWAALRSLSMRSSSAR
jgi:hypothetical protein